ncbi:MAG: lysogenization regulator HflD [Gammaproteobacteria bacterium]|nr:MAG: lysogenization regulator HflD [Gammaproteobacteria bacterium]
MSHSKYEQTLALSGVYQAAALVKQIATKGNVNSAQVESSLETLFRFDANNVEEVYGSASSIGLGIKTLCGHLNDKSSRDIDITKYVISLIMLERKLSNNKAMLEELSKRLNKIESQFNFFTLDHENTIAKIGHLYKDTISTLGPKIIVSGEQPYLSNEINANKIRALLLAGIRSTVLWSQCGGSRWQILFGRKSYTNECKKILTQL